MAGSVNKVILVGNLGKDPESRSTQSGSKIVNLTIATSETWNDKASGERKEKTEWHRVVLFNERAADFAEKYLKKGAKVYVEGALQTRKWTDNAGVEKYTTEIVVSAFKGELTSLDSGRSGGDSSMGDAGGYQPRAAAAKPAARPAAAASGNSWDAGRGGGDLDDEIPF